LREVAAVRTVRSDSVSRRGEKGEGSSFPPLVQAGKDVGHTRGEAHLPKEAPGLRRGGVRTTIRVCFAG
jgi:hypothetical protein